MGIRIPAGESPESPAVVAALRTIAARYGAPADEASIEATERGTAAAIAVLRKDGEWRDVLARPVPVEDGRPRSGFLGTSVTPRTITFAGAPLRDLREQLSAAQESFVRHRSFAGLAIHDYKHITELLKR
jgi:hypothetical protein